MNLYALAKKLCKKHSLASIDDSELVISSQIKGLYKVLENYNVLMAAYQSDPKSPKNPNEEMAVAGHKVLKDIVRIINYLNSKSSIKSLLVKEAVLELLKLTKDDTMKLVSELVWHLIPIRRKPDINFRNSQINKAKHGLSRINSLCISILKEIHDLPDDANIAFSRLDVDSRTLSEAEIISFIRQYGSRFGINNLEDWRIVTENDPALRESLKDAINALTRGHEPRNAFSLKLQIDEILENSKKG